MDGFVDSLIRCYKIRKRLTESIKDEEGVENCDVCVFVFTD